MADGLYVFCVTEGALERELDVGGLGGGPVFTCCAGDMCAVSQWHEGSPFPEQPELVSRRVLDHQRVVDFVWKQGAVVPFSFGTVVVPKDGRSAVENLREWLGREHPALARKLDRLRGKAECGVQIWWDSAVVAARVTRSDAEVRAIEEEAGARDQGAAYLLRRKLEHLVRKRLELAADAYFKEFYRRIRECSEEIRVEAVKREAPPRQMLANLSCLLAQRDISGLGAALEKLARIEGISVRFTGPWPPYSFVNA